MSIKTRLRPLHRKLAPWLFPPLLLLAATGLTYRIGRSWFGMSKETGSKVMHLHSGAWFGTDGSVIYLFLIGGALLFLIFSGLWMWFSGKNTKAPLRKSHRLLAIILSLPLTLSAITGMAYHAGTHWFQAEEATLKILMSLHQGTWLGPDLRPFYILLLGSGLIALCLTGLRMWLPKKSGGVR